MAMTISQRLHIYLIKLKASWGWFPLVNKNHLWWFPLWLQVLQIRLCQKIAPAPGCGSWSPHQWCWCSFPQSQLESSSLRQELNHIAVLMIRWSSPKRILKKKQWKTTSLRQIDLPVDTDGTPITCPYLSLTTGQYQWPSSIMSISSRVRRRNQRQVRFEDQSATWGYFQMQGKINQMDLNSMRHPGVEIFQSLLPTLIG